MRHLPRHCLPWMRVLVPLAALLLATTLATTADACPTCKHAVAENDAAQQGLVKGYFYSILFMMSMPFLLLGTFGGLVFVTIRRNDRSTTESVAEPQECAASDE